MRPAKLVLLVVLALALALPAAAGEESKQCPYTAQECLDQMAARFKNTGWIGVELDISEDSPGWVVRSVIPGSPAAKAGLQANDVLWSFEGTVLSRENEEVLMKARKDKMKVGSTVSYVVKRNGKEIPVKITLEAWPADLVARYVGEHMLQHAATDVASSGK
jgi:C-terminal processing protease CtpA/Prc